MCSTVSIISCTLNAENYLEQSIKSVLNQDYNKIQYIVIDGGSIDSTLSIINKYSSAISYSVSEPDSGIADAMNKGIRKASGDYIIFLGADDYIPAKNTIKKALDFVDETVDFHLYDVIIDNQGVQKLSKSKNFGWYTDFKMAACHQGQLIAKSSFDKLGGLDTTFSYCMDYEFLMRAYRSGARSTVINMPLSVMRQTGISSRKDWAGLKDRFDEERRIHMKYCPSTLMKMIYAVYWSVYIPYRRCRSLVTAT